MGLLATAVTAAPFLGLLGTVWGVMDAFKAMAASGTVTLSEVAPGISGALLTTVVGLLVALPSLIGYNLLTNQMKRICLAMDNFAEEFTNDIERAFIARPQ
jgi:biopolymer transport protein TolQ